MAGLKKTLESIPNGGTRRVFGTAYHDGSRWWANLDGNLIDAGWMYGAHPVQGGPIVVDLTNNGTGQSSAMVMGGYGDQPLTTTGVVLAVGVTELVFAVEDGSTYTTDRFIGTYRVLEDMTVSTEYMVNDEIFIDWSAGTPTVIGRVPTITVTPSVTPPVAPAPVVGTGTAKAPAGKTNTYWSPGGWGSWAGSTQGGEQIYTGSYGAGPTTGSWFYGAAFTNLGTKTIEEIRFRMPARLNIGASGSATVHLYAHTSKYQPGGDVSRTVGPHDVVVTQGQPAHWITLPLSFAAVLKAGGGISIAGDPYAGFQGRLQDPQSGRIEMDWTT